MARMIDMPAMGATNWPPPSYNPQTELFYLNGNRGLRHGVSVRHVRQAGRLRRRRRR